MTLIRFPIVVRAALPLALAVFTSACASATLEPPIPRHATLSMPYAQPGCLAMRGPLAQVMNLVAPAPPAEDPGAKRRPVEMKTVLAIAARLRALPPASPPADDGVARTSAFLDQLASGPPEALDDRVAARSDEGRQLLATVAEACKMPSLTRGTLDPSALRHTTFPNVRRCFSAGSHPSGLILITLLIERDGGVSAAYPAVNKIGDPRLAMCLARSFEDVAFPRPDGGVALLTFPLRVR